MQDYILKRLIATVILFSAIYALYYHFSPYENCMRANMAEEAAWNRKKAIILEGGGDRGEEVLLWFQAFGIRTTPPACKKFQIIW